MNLKRKKGTLDYYWQKDFFKVKRKVEVFSQGKAQNFEHLKEMFLKVLFSLSYVGNSTFT